MDDHGATGCLSQDADQGARPIPPRFRWLKRIALAGAVFLLGLVGIRLWWGHVGESRLQAKIAAYHAAGEPILLADFAREPIPDEQNGAYFLEQAAAQLGQPVELSDVIRDLRTGKVVLAAARKYLEDNAEALRLVREARSRSATDWQIPLRSPVIATFTFPGVSSQRALAKMTCAAALYEHALGDDAAALEAIRDDLAISRHVGRMEVGLIADLVGTAIEDLGTTAAEAIAHEIAVTDSPGSESPGAQPGTREQVRALIRDLLDETELRESFRRALRHERMQPLDTVTALCEGRFSVAGLVASGPTLLPSLAERTFALFVGPAWKLDALRLMERLDIVARAGTAPNWPTAQQQLPPDPTLASAAEQLSRFLTKYMMPAVDRVVLMHFWLYADRRMAAVALAMRLYELDHGQRPAALAELVPDYLPAVPLDPFDPNDGPIRYLRDAPSPLLYSIGSNGVDDAGTVVFKSDGFIDRAARDCPFYLNGDRPLPPLPPDETTSPPDETTSPPASQPTSTQAVVDDEQVEHPGGDEDR